MTGFGRVGLACEIRAFPPIYPVALTPPEHSPQMSAATAPVTHAPPILWAAARALNLFALFGEPSAID